MSSSGMDCNKYILYMNEFATEMLPQLKSFKKMKSDFYFLQENELPTQWYNIQADMKNKPAPLLNSKTLKPMTEDELSEVFCRELARQELDDTNAYYEIPEEIRSFYKMYRPAPLTRAYCLEEKLGTPAKIYYKFEGNNTSGSHKLNSQNRSGLLR